MRSSLVEIADIRLEKPAELLLLEDQEVIQAFTPHTQEKAFTHGIGLRGSVRRSKLLDTTRCCYTRTTRPEFAIIIPNQLFRRVSIRSRFPQLLRHPQLR